MKETIYANNMEMSHFIYAEHQNTIEDELKLERSFKTSQRRPSNTRTHRKAHCNNLINKTLFFKITTKTTTTASMATITWPGKRDKFLMQKTKTHGHGPTKLRRSESNYDNKKKKTDSLNCVAH